MSGYARTLNQPLSDVFTDIQNAGQEIIDQGAAAVGIDKGGTIDSLVTTGAQIGRDAAGVSTVDQTVRTLTGGGQSTPAPTPGATTPGTTAAPSAAPGFLQKMSMPWAAGGAVIGGVGSWFIWKRWWVSLLFGLGLGAGTGLMGPHLTKASTPVAAK